MREPALIAELAERDIRVWASGERLRVDAAAGALTPELRARLTESRGELLSFLRGPGPLSFAQERLWILDQLEPGSATYIVPVGLLLEGRLDVEALRRALGDLVARHAALRTSFREQEGGVVQIVADPVTIVLPVVDVSTKPDSLEVLLRHEAARGFDLGVAPLFRAVLYRLAPDHHVLLLVQHHSVTDAWSLNVLMGDLGALYVEHVNGRSASLPELTANYRDYARWQRRTMQGDELALQQEYWRSSLTGAPQTLDLPTDRARPPVEAHRGAFEPFKVAREVSNNVYTLARHDGATPFMVLLSAFEVLLWRYTEQEDFLVGTAVAGRPREEFEGLIGLFVNSLVIRGNTSGNPTGRELIARVREACLSAYANDALPFERVVELLRPERDLSRNPLFQVMIVLQGSPAKPFDVPGLEARRVFVDRGSAQVDLTLNVLESPDGFSGAFEYATDLFERATIVRMAEHFETLLRSLVANPDQPVATLPLLTEAEREEQHHWNETAAPVSAQCVHELIARQAASAGSRVAVEFGEETLTYDELEARANRLAARLRSHGAAPGVRVGVFLERSLEMVVGVLGILKAGAAYVPLDPAFPAERLAFMLEDSGAALVVTSAALARVVPSPALPRVLVDVEEPPLPTASPAPAAPATPDDLAYVIYTSGSTGRPKGVAITHRALVNLLESMAREPGLHAQDVLLSVTTLSFDIAGLELYLPLIQGARVVLASRDEASDGALLMARLATSGATMMQATPATWRLLLQSGWTGNPRLTVLCGGEALPRDLADVLVAKVGELWNVYGPTETTIWSSAGRVQSGHGPVSIGRPIANTQLWVLDARLQPLPVGVPGELYIGGLGLAQGYWHRPELTAERFIPDPFAATPGARLYKTGDRARWLANGTLECLGRLDTQVKLRGFRIELGEIEAALHECPGVGQAAVVSQDVTGAEPRLVAFLTASPTMPIDTTTVRAKLGTWLPAYMVPAAYVVLDALPLTPNGKIDRKALKKRDAGGVSSAAVHVAPRTPTEEAVAAIWAETLQVPSLSIDDNFFDVGGHSLSAARIITRLRSTFDVDVRLRALFEQPTIAGLSEVVDLLVVSRGDLTARATSVTREEFEV